VVFLIVGVIWVAGNSSAQARYEAERALYENDLTEYNQCQTRVASSAKLSDLANANSVLAEAQDKLGTSLVHTFDAIYQLASDPESETARAFGAIIAQLREDVAEVSEASAVVKEAASQYDRVDPATCPPEPTPPGG
jgi:flagellar hook-associated protein FlgK